MDAKPQRPRAMRIYDENMPPPAQPVKTLHHRTKSVPAFSSFTSGATKTTMAVKKVLGEANANLKVFSSAKDDSMIGKKLVTLDVKPNALTLARPAARPSTAKSLSTFAIPKDPIASQYIVPLQEPAKKVVAKKSTKVLKDSEAPGLPAETLISQHSGSDVNEHDSLKQAEPPLSHASLSSLELVSASEHLPPTSTKQVVEAKLDTLVQAKVEADTRAQSSFMPGQYYPEEFDYFEDDFTLAQTTGLRGESLGGATVILAPKETEKERQEIHAARMYVEDCRPQEDIDDEEWDTSMVAEYSDEIFSYMRQLENRMLPNPRYMDTQTEIQWSMRAVLIDWVVQVHQRFNLLPETLFLSVNYIDRFLTFKVVSLGKLQLVGATALFIAAKFEEVNCPTLQEIIFMVDGGYTVDELLKAERFMLSMLQFDLGWPGPMSFLRRVSKADDYDLETRTIAKYFLEVTLMDERFVGCTPSYLAAGAHCMARLILRKGDWSVSHVAYSGYTYAQLRPLLTGMCECCENARKHHLSVFEKYTDKRYKRASLYVEQEMRCGFGLQPQVQFHGSLIPASFMPAVLA